MEKDIDEVGKVSRYIKSKIEGLDKEVTLFVAFIGFKCMGCSCDVSSRLLFLCGPEFNK